MGVLFKQIEHLEMILSNWVLLIVERKNCKKKKTHLSPEFESWLRKQNSYDDITPGYIVVPQIIVVT